MSIIPCKVCNATGNAPSVAGARSGACSRCMGTGVRDVGLELASWYRLHNRVPCPKCLAGRPSAGCNVCLGYIQTSARDLTLEQLRDVVPAKSWAKLCDILAAGGTVTPRRAA